MLQVLARNLMDGVALGPSFAFRHVSRLVGRRYHTARIPGVGKVCLRPNGSDAETFVDVFRRRAYDFSWLKHYDRPFGAYRRTLETGCAPLIIDAGANVGAATLWFCREFPGARVVAIEPDPDNAEVLRLNTKDRRNVEVVVAAVGSRNGTASLANPDKQAWAVRARPDPEGSVQLTTINDILAQRVGKSLFLVKIDIEGAEGDLFESHLEWLAYPEVVIIEPHDWMLPGAGTSRNFQRALLERDFEMVICGENLVFLRT